MLKKLFFVTAILYLAFHTQVSAQRPVVRAKAATSAGDVEFVQTGNNYSGTGAAEWQVKLKGKVLGKLSEPYDAIKIVKVIKDFEGKENVVIFLGEMTGSACASTYNLLAVRADGESYITEPIYNCAAPKLAQTSDKITLYFPRSPVMQGTGFVPAETWIYQNGKLRQQKSTKRGR